MLKLTSKKYTLSKASVLAVFSFVVLFSNFTHASDLIGDELIYSKIIAHINKARGVEEDGISKVVEVSATEVVKPMVAVSKTQQAENIKNLINQNNCNIVLPKEIIELIKKTYPDLDEVDFSGKISLKDGVLKPTQSVSKTEAVKTVSIVGNSVEVAKTKPSILPARTVILMDAKGNKIEFLESKYANILKDSLKAKKSPERVSKKTSTKTKPVAKKEYKKVNGVSFLDSKEVDKFLSGLGKGDAKTSVKSKVSSATKIAAPKGGVKDAKVTQATKSKETEDVLDHKVKVTKNSKGILEFEYEYLFDEAELSISGRNKLLEFIDKISKSGSSYKYDIKVSTDPGPFGSLATLGNDRLAFIKAFLRQHDLNIDSKDNVELFVNSRGRQYIRLLAVKKSNVNKN